MLSVALRRSAMMAARNPTTFSKAAAFSTQAKAQAQVVEEMCATKHWADVRDEVKEIRCILNEPKTNQALHIPEDTVAFEQKVSDSMTAIQNMLSSEASNHDEIYAKAHDLKLDVKHELYHFA